MKIVLLFLLFAFSFIGFSPSLQAASATTDAKAPAPKIQMKALTENWKGISHIFSALKTEKKGKAAIIYLSLMILFLFASGFLYVIARNNVKLWTLTLLLGIVGIAFMLLWLIQVMTGGRPLF